MPLMTIGKDTAGLIELEEHEPGYLLGTVTILAVPHHVELIEVLSVESQEDGNWSYCQEPHTHDHQNNNGQRFADILAFAGEPMHPVELPGYEGRRFICVVTPYSL